MNTIYQYGSAGKRFLFTPLLLLLIVLGACNEDPGISLPQSALLGIVDTDETIFEDEDSGVEIEITFIEPALAAGTVTIDFDGADYGTDFTTDPAGSENGLTLNVAEGATTLSFTVLPVNNTGVLDLSKTVGMSFAASGGVSFGLDNAAAITIVNRPELSVNGTIADFGRGLVDIPTSAQSLTLNGLGLTGDVTLSVEGAQFTVSTDNSNFVQNESIDRAEVEATDFAIYVRYLPDGVASHAGTLTIESDELATPIVLNLAGEGVVPQFIAGTSFEEPALGTDNYTSTGDADFDHDLVNNAAEFVVDYVAAGSELGFDAGFKTNGGSGCTSDTVGVVDNFAGLDFDSYPDGTQGYAIFDSDGAAVEVTFDAVDLSAFSGVTATVDVFITSATYEASSPDFLDIYVLGDGGTRIDLFRTSDIDDIDDLVIDGSSPEGRWITVSADLSGNATATLVVAGNTNRDDEGFYIDNVRFSGF